MKRLEAFVAVAACAALFACGSKDDSKSNKGKAKPVGGEGAHVVPKPKDLGPVYPVYSLLDNRLSAHLLRDGGLMINGGSAGFAKYIRFSEKPVWGLRAKVGDVAVAVLAKNSGLLDVPLSKKQAAGAPTLRLRVHSPAARRLSVRINGDRKREQNFEVAAGWSTLTKKLPAGLFRHGENRIVLFASDGDPLSLAWLHIAPAGSKAAGPGMLRKGTSLLLPDKGGLVYYLNVPRAKGVHLVGDVSAGCTVTAVAAGDNASGLEASMQGKSASVSLDPVQGNVVRLELIASGCAMAELGNPRVVVSGKKPQVPPSKAPKPEYVILWIMDSLRADRMQAFNPKARAKTPTFDALAKDSTLFLQAYVQGNESRASHSAIWASLYSAKHQFFTHKGRLAAKWTTIDEVAKKAKLFTSGVSGNGYVRPKRGFGKWDAFRNHIHLKAGLTGQNIYDRAIKSVKGKKQGWFLYMGTIDTHVTWRAKKPWIDEYDKGYKGKFKKFAAAVHVDNRVLSKRDIERVRAIYDSNVSYQDELLKKLMAQLDEWGIKDKTMLIITADHGDEMWEHGEKSVGHGKSLHETVVHVPLLIRYPPLFPGRKVSAGVEVIDILPTVAEALGIPADEEWQGVSLLPLAHGAGHGVGYPRLRLATYPVVDKGNKVREKLAARVGDWKMKVFGVRKPELFDLAADPGEHKNVVAESPTARRYMSDVLWMMRTYNAEWRKSRWGNAANVSARFAADMGE